MILNRLDDPYPILDRSGGEQIENKNLFKLVMVSIFALSAHQSQQPSLEESTQMQQQAQEELIPAGQFFFNQAKFLIGELNSDRVWRSSYSGTGCAYQISHLYVCQSLLLMALREFGVGALSQAWMYAGTKLSLHEYNA